MKSREGTAVSETRYVESPERASGSRSMAGLWRGIRLRDSGRHLPRSGDLCRNLGALLLVVGRTIILAGSWPIRNLPLLVDFSTPRAPSVANCITSLGRVPVIEKSHSANLYGVLSCMAQVLSKIFIEILFSSFEKQLSPLEYLTGAYRYSFPLRIKAIIYSLGSRQGILDSPQLTIQIWISETGD